ncbi:MAG: hypothetical protein WDO24_13695, partial [Pseudomonadota bacterium]
RDRTDLARDRVGERVDRLAVADVAGIGVAAERLGGALGRLAVDIDRDDARPACAMPRAMPSPMRIRRR